MMIPVEHPDATRQARRSDVKNNARLAWMLAAIVLLLYVGGLFIQRG